MACVNCTDNLLVVFASYSFRKILFVNDTVEELTLAGKFRYKVNGVGCVVDGDEAHDMRVVQGPEDLGLGSDVLF